MKQKKNSVQGITRKSGVEAERAYHTKWTIKKKTLV